MSQNAIERFGARASAYACARPTYPEQMLAFFDATLGLSEGQRIADLGSGTGILTEQLLNRGLRVDAVEPNAAMRSRAESRLAQKPGFRSVNAPAESTGLDPDSVDWVIAAQAFHWFDVQGVRAEIRRILKPGGVCALVWNSRLTDASPFLRDYEAFLAAWGTDYAAVKNTYEVPEAIAAVLGPAYGRATFPNAQDLDYEGLSARLLSVSYVPAADDPRTPSMLEALRDLFDAHANGGAIRIEYATNVYYARLTG